MAQTADEAVARGLQLLLRARQELVAAGFRPVGWKAAFGSPQAMQRLGISRPLVGFLTERTLLAPDSVVSIAGWTRPVAEPEVAVYLGRDIPPQAPPELIRQAIAALGPAIELADVDRPAQEQLEAVVAGNVYHRHFILGPRDTARAGGDLAGLVGHVFRGGQRVAVVEDLQANPGPMVEVLAGMARALAQAGEALRAGQVVITGSVVPPIPLTDQDDFLAFELVGLGRVSVRFRATANA